MRVIAGRLRSRLLKSVPGLDTRPTPDRLREALFNVLAPEIEGSVLVDAYAGTGAVGIEALSRGASRAIFIERNRAALKVLRENLETLALTDSAQVVDAKAAIVLDRYNADIVFIDPPYDAEREYQLALERLGANPPALVIVQHATRHALAESYGQLMRKRVLKQGDNSLSFFRPSPRASENTDVPAGQ